jgi:hypothetical protein
LGDQARDHPEHVDRSYQDRNCTPQLSLHHRSRARILDRCPKEELTFSYAADQAARLLFAHN